MSKPERRYRTGRDSGCRQGEAARGLSFRTVMESGDGLRNDPVTWSPGPWVAGTPWTGSERGSNAI